MKVAPVAEIKERPFPKLGITMEGIQNFIGKVGLEKLKGLTTTEVSPIVQSLTRDGQCSYCDHPIASSDSIKVANVFVSHAWKYKFLNVVSALQNHYKHKSKVEQQQVVFWFDLFSNSQHGLDSGTPPPFSWWCNTFMSAIKDIGTVVMVLEPWSNPVTLTRVWCLWEVYCASATKSKFEIAMSESETGSYREQIVNDTSGFIRMLSNIDVRNSDAFNPLDKDQIFKVITRSVGFAKLNGMVLSTVRKWAMRDLNNYVKTVSDETNKADIFTALGEIGLAADLVADIVKPWLRDAHSLYLKLYGENNDKTLRCLRSLVKIDITHYDKACELLLKRFGDHSVYHWDVKMLRATGEDIEEIKKSWTSWEIDTNNAQMVADLLFRVMNTVGFYSRFNSDDYAVLTRVIATVKQSLPANNVSMLKLEIVLITRSERPYSDAKFQSLHQYTSRLKETLGYDHQDVRRAFSESRNFAFDNNRNDYFFGYARENWNSSVILFETIELMEIATLVACVPCNICRANFCCAFCDGEIYRDCCIILPSYLICLGPLFAVEICFAGCCCRTSLKEQQWTD